MIAYINEDNEIISVNSFKRVNGGRNLSQSQLKLLGLKKIRIKKNSNEKGNTNEEK
jgi:hypothetical protein|tara:strand:- start:4916 stop:5083 length:168 start_codon:yes stop_codon:yes gene_type:complete